MTRSPVPPITPSTNADRRVRQPAMDRKLRIRPPRIVDATSRTLVRRLVINPDGQPGPASSGTDRVRGEDQGQGA